jgi:hypothetical protein
MIGIPSWRRGDNLSVRSAQAVDSVYDLLGACGLYCGACYHYRASLPEGQHLLEMAVDQGRSLDGCGCQGCRSGVLYCHPGCSHCAMRRCAEGRKLVHCGLCSEFPCDRIRAFQSGGRIHHRDVLVHLEELTVIGPDRWLAQQAQRWRCRCGAGFSWYEVLCQRCGAPLASYGSGPAARQDPSAPRNAGVQTLNGG